MSIKISIVPVTQFQQNCSIIVCEKTNKAAIVDPGGDLPNIIEAVAELGASVEKILITHAHIDHAGAAKETAEHFSVAIEGPHKGDQFWIDKLADQSRMFQFPDAQPFEPSRWLDDHDTVSVGELSFDVVHCPGHTPGHVVFIQKDEKIAIVGDVIFAGSIGRTDFPMGDHQQLVDSIQQKLFPLGDDIVFIPGHGPTSSFGHEKQTNPFVGGQYG